MRLDQAGREREEIEEREEREREMRDMLPEDGSEVEAVFAKENTSKKTAKEKTLASLPRY
jgi:hypothetical protein